MLEKVEYPFMHEFILKHFINTLDKIIENHTEKINNNQGDSEDYDIYSACRYSRALIYKELDELLVKKDALIKELNSKYGLYLKDYIITETGIVKRINSNLDQ